MKVEFFHDVVCSFCFPMSYKMRAVAKQMPELDIIHRSFALVWSREDLISMFGSLPKAKQEILNHWEHANITDPERRFNIEGMRAADFDFPHSSNVLTATKAAGIIGGEEAYWDLFDALQTAMFVNSRDISSWEVIESCVKSTDVDFNAWKRQVEDPATLEKVNADLRIARRYGIRSVPMLVVDGTHLISGSVPTEQIIASLESIVRKTGLQQANAGEACDIKGICS
jgi:predicted DsbA family dithiol-disulfide isomerase